MVCLENIWLLYPKSQNKKIIIEIFACPKRRILGDYLSKRQVGQFLAKSLGTNNCWLVEEYTTNGQNEDDNQKKLRISRPTSTALLAISRQLTYHWGLSRGSMMSLERLQTGTTMGLSCVPRYSSRFFSDFRTAFLAWNLFIPCHREINRYSIQR